MRKGKAVRALVAAGIANDDVLVIRKRADVGFLGRQLLLAEVGGEAQFGGIGYPRPSVAGALIDLADDLPDVQARGPRRYPSVNEDASAMDGDLHAHERVGFLPEGGGDNALGDGIGQTVGMAG